VSGALRGPLVGLLVLLVASTPSPAGPWAAAGSAVAAAANYSLASPTLTVIEPDGVQTFVSATTAGYPELAFDSSGNLVLAFLENNSAAFARFNKTTTQFLTPPTRVSNRTTTDSPTSDIGRGPRAALNGRGEIVTAYWDYIDPGTGLFDRVYVAAHNLNGTQVLNETQVGQSQSFFWPSPSVAIGLNDSFYIAREVPDGDYNLSAIGLEHRAADGSPIFTYLTVFNDSTVNHYPQLVADLVRSRLVLAWFNDIGEERLVALGLNGSVIWGPVTVPTYDRGFSFTVGPDGSIYGVFLDGSGDLRASKFAADGNPLVSGRLVSSTPGLWAKVPRCALSPQGELYVVWEEEDGTGFGEVQAAALNSSDLSLLSNPGSVSDDVGPSEMPHVGFSPQGVPWVVWRSADPAFVEPDRINGTFLRTRTFSFGVETPLQNVTAYRAEPNDIPVNFSSFSDTRLTFALNYALSSVRGPWNWTVEFLDAVTGAPALTYDLSGNASAGVIARVTPPVWDPPGNGLILIIEVREARISNAALTLLIGVTVEAGHRYAITPSDQNATGLAGSTAQLPYQLRNEGVFEAQSLPITLSPPPPPGWSAVTFPTEFSALPGESQVVTLTVTGPAGGTSADAYCGVLSVQHPVDVYALASATFCARVALVAEPRVTPQAQSLSVESGAATPLRFTFENVGNSAAPLTCHLAIVEALPPGWSVAGNPLTVVLPRNTPVAVSWSVALSPAVTGGQRLALTVRASCEGVSSEQDASVVLTVLEVHDLQWSTPPPTVQTNASGGALQAAWLENLGNVAEPLAASEFSVPPGWRGSVHWTVDGAPAASLAPGRTALATVLVQAPPMAEASVYRFSVAVGGGAGPAEVLSLSVEVPAAYGVSVQFSPPSLFARPGEVVSFVGRVLNLGNAQDLFQVKVSVASFQLWSWAAEFVPSIGQGSLSSSGGYLSLAPFAEGTLYVYLTAPEAPSGGEVGVNISLSSAGRSSDAWFGVLRVRLPDLQVVVEAVPAGEAAPLLVGGILVNVTCTGGVFVDNVTLRVVVDGVSLFDSRVGPFCGPDARAFEITVSVAPGAHSVTAAVDPDEPGASPIYGFILESDEDNNVATRSFSIRAGPATQPPPTNGTSAGLGGSTAVVVLAAMGGAGAVAVLAAFRRRRGRSEGP